MGLPNASLVQPVNFTLVFAALTTFFNIYVAAYGQFTLILIQRAIAGPVNKILFNVIPKTFVAWSRTFIRRTVLKVGMLAVYAMADLMPKPALVLPQSQFHEIMRVYPQIGLNTNARFNK